MLSNESVLGIPIQAFADTVIGFLVFGTALMMTGAGKFFINLSVRAVRHVPRRRRQGLHLRERPARHDVGHDRVQRADRRHHDDPGDEAHRLPRVLRGRDRGLRVDRRRARAAGDGRHRLRHRAVPQRQLRRGRARGGHSGAALLRRPVHAGRRLCGAPRARRASPRAELPSVWVTIKEGWYYVFVIALLVVMLLHFKRESHAPFYATALLLVLNQLFSKDTRWTLAHASRNSSRSTAAPSSSWSRSSPAAAC